MTIVVTMTKLLFAMAVGFYLNKKNILDVETSKKLSAMVVNLTSPLLIISSAGSVAGYSPYAGGRALPLCLLSPSLFSHGQDGSCAVRLQRRLSVHVNVCQYRIYGISGGSGIIRRNGYLLYYDF